MPELLDSPTALIIAAGVIVVMLGLVVWLILRNRRNTFATPLEKATFATLHTVALAAPALREGLSRPRPRSRCPTCGSCWTPARWR